MLLALLTDNLTATILYGSVWNGEQETDLMQYLMDGKYLFGGSSLWFEYRNGTGR